MRLIREQGVDPNSCDSYGETLLQIAAARNGRHKTLEKLIRHGADVNGRNHENGRTALHSACLAGHEKNISVLLKHGADVNIQDKQSYSPFMLILFSKVFWHKPQEQLRLAEQFIKINADLSFADKYGYTVIDHVKQSRNPDLVNMVQAAYEIQRLLPSIQDGNDCQAEQVAF